MEHVGIDVHKKEPQLCTIRRTWPRSAAHHPHGVHRGWIRVSGRAPDHLVWELGEREEVSARAA